MKLTQLKKPEPLTKMAYEALRSSILLNKMTTDIIYNEKNLAEKLGISRTPVREALLELSSQGLVTFLPRKGVIIKKFTDHDVEEIFELRCILETGALKKACSQRKLLDLTEIKQYVAVQRCITTGNKNVSNFMEMDRNFHMAFARLTGNQRLITIMENIRDITHIMGSHALSTEGRMKEVVEEHDNILQAVLKGNVDNALEHLENHLNLSKAAVKYLHS